MSQHMGLRIKCPICGFYVPEGWYHQHEDLFVCAGCISKFLSTTSGTKIGSWCMWMHVRGTHWCVWCCRWLDETSSKWDVQEHSSGRLGRMSAQYKRVDRSSSPPPKGERETQARDTPRNRWVLRLLFCQFRAPLLTLLRTSYKSWGTCWMNVLKCNVLSPDW